MLFQDFVETVHNLADMPDDAAPIALANLFERAEFGEAGLLVALCSQKSTWDIHPWLTNPDPENLFLPAHFPKPHTLPRVFAEMQRITKAKAGTAASRKQVLLTSLEPVSAEAAQNLLSGKKVVTSHVLEAALLSLPLSTGVPIPPEKLTRYTSREIEQVWQKLGRSYGHIKDDGFYCQLHKLGTRVLVYTGANLLEQTRHYPEIVSAARRQIAAYNAILDGELVGLDANEQVLPRSRMHRAVYYQVRLFDLLGINETDWRHRPYRQRREKRLAAVAGQPNAVLRQATEFEINTKVALLTYFEQCVAEEWEGMVVKQVDTPYRSNTRNPTSIKLKQVEPIDVTIVGYFLSAGRVETFLVALYNEQTGQFEACARTHAGLSAKEIEAVQTLVDTAPGQDPAQPVVVNLAPDVWVKPRFVFEMRVDYRYLSNDYLCALPQTGQGWGLHNPVFQSPTPRLDKAGHHTTTIAQLLKLRVETGKRQEGSDVQSSQDDLIAGHQLGFGWVNSGYDSDKK